ncbi:MAG: hypothetical protein PVH88_05145 [Ignavibacteria bacterium]|jgi:hypothetical protein
MMAKNLEKYHRILHLVTKKNENVDENKLCFSRETLEKFIHETVNPNIMENEFYSAFESQLYYLKYSNRYDDLPIKKYALFDEDLYNYEQTYKHSLPTFIAGITLVDGHLILNYRPPYKRDENKDEDEQKLDIVAKYAYRRGFIHGILICPGDKKCNDFCPDIPKCNSNHSLEITHDTIKSRNEGILSDLSIEKIINKNDQYLLASRLFYLSLFYLLFFNDVKKIFSV